MRHLVGDEVELLGEEECETSADRAHQQHLVDLLNTELMHRLAQSLDDVCGDEHLEREGDAASEFEFNAIEGDCRGWLRQRQPHLLRLVQRVAEEQERSVDERDATCKEQDAAAECVDALEETRCADPTDPCPVFLMTNCRNASALEQLVSALPSPPLRYEPSAPPFANEGRRLLVEQAIAARALRFVGSPRSAVTEYVETLRRGRERERAQRARAKEEL